MFKQEKNNIYDYLIMLTIMSLAYGDYELLGALHPVRIIGLMGIAICIQKWGQLKYSVFNKWVTFLLVFGFYIVLSVLWTPNKTYGLIYGIHMTTMIGCMMLIFLSAMKAEFPLRSLCKGWLMFSIITIPIALWEITTGQHLSSGSYNIDSVIDGHYRIFAAVTFGNLNSYVLMMTMSQPFLLLPVLQKDTSQKAKIIYATAFVITSYLCIICASRTGLIITTLAWFLFAIFKLRQTAVVANIVVQIITILFIFLLVSNYEQIQLFEQVIARMDGKSSIMEDASRLSLIKRGLHAFLWSLPFGGGVNSMQYMYETYAPSSVNVAHNMVIELLIEYGLISIFLFYLFYQSVFKLTKANSVVVQYLFWFVLLSSPLMFTVDDAYVVRANMWVYMACVVSLAEICKYKT